MRAFTLLELLVAMTITLVIAALMLSVTSGMLTLWRRSQNAHIQVTAAEQVLDAIEQDLHAAHHRRDGHHWLAVDLIDSANALANHGWVIGSHRMKPADGDSLLPLPPAAADGKVTLHRARFGLSGSWFRFVTTQVESGGSLPVVVAYQMVRRPVSGNPVATNAAPVRYSLFRSAVDNGGTLDAGYDVTAAAYASTSPTPPSAANAYRQPRNVMNPSQANLLASNVVDFGVWLYSRNDDGSLRLIHPAGADDRSHHAAGNSLAWDSRHPEVAEVMVRILTEEGAILLETIEAGRLAERPPAYSNDAAWWWGVVEAHSRTFTRRIEIKGGAL